MNGLKENVIVGRLIPAGTGSYVNQVRKLAADRDAIAMAAYQQSDAIDADGENAIEDQRDVANG